MSSSRQPPIGTPDFSSPPHGRASEHIAAGMWESLFCFFAETLVAWLSVICASFEEENSAKLSPFAPALFLTKALGFVVSRFRNPDCLIGFREGEFAEALCTTWPISLKEHSFSIRAHTHFRHTHSASTGGAAHLRVGHGRQGHRERTREILEGIINSLVHCPLVPSPLPHTTTPARPLLLFSCPLLFSFLAS